MTAEEKKEYQKEWRKNHPGYLKEWRHKNGISVHYGYKGYPKNYKNKPYTKIFKQRTSDELQAINRKLNKQRYKARSKGGGELTVKTIQLIYEDNIKKYGTLTCYLCFNPIEFGKDNLEHKTPLIRGGNNNYENLEVACCKCNLKKGSKTEEEYRNGAPKTP